MQTFRQEGHQIVLQIHPNILRLRVQNVLLQLAEYFDIVLGLLLLLLPYYALQIFLLLDFGSFLDGEGGLRHFILLPPLDLLVIVKRHVIEWFFILNKGKSTQLDRLEQVGTY